MARYKDYDYKQTKLIPVSFRDQILPGSFEYALNEIVDQHIDLTPFAKRYANDETGPTVRDGRRTAAPLNRADRPDACASRLSGLRISRGPV